MSEEDIRLGCDHVPGRYACQFLDSFDPSVGRAASTAKAAVERLVAEELDSVLLSGPVGCGKTHLAAAACNEIASPLQDAVFAADIARDRRDPQTFRTLEIAVRALERRCPVWVTVPFLLALLRREMGSNSRAGSELVELAAKARGLVVLDDVGAEKASEWTAATLFEIVGARYEVQAPTIVTSNLSASRLVDAGYERVVSRLRDNGALVEMASARDYRVGLRKSVA